MRTVDDLNLTDKQKAEFNAYAAEVSDLFDKGITPTEGAKPPVLMELKRLRFQRMSLEKDMAALVVQARRDGNSWHKIGLALGTTGEAARNRYKTLQSA